MYVRVYLLLQVGCIVEQGQHRRKRVVGRRARKPGVADDDQFVAISKEWLHTGWAYVHGTSGPATVTARMSTECVRIDMAASRSRDILPSTSGYASDSCCPSLVSRAWVFEKGEPARCSLMSVGSFEGVNMQVVSREKNKLPMLSLRSDLSFHWHSHQSCSTILVSSNCTILVGSLSLRSSCAKGEANRRARSTCQQALGYGSGGISATTTSVKDTSIQRAWKDLESEPYSTGRLCNSGVAVVLVVSKAVFREGG